MDKIGKSRLLRLRVENFDNIALSRTVKEIEANLCFSIFGKNSKIQIGCHFLGEEIFLKIEELFSSDNLWVENFDEIALSRTVKGIEAIQNGRQFWREENFLKIPVSTFLRYPVGRKCRQNHSISHG